MRTAIFYGPSDIRIEERPCPSEPASQEADSVTLRVLRSGVCGTDASEWLAGPLLFPLEQPHAVTGHVGPMALGHEFIGEVVAAGSEAVRNFPPGSLVASGAGVWCSTCERCIEGRTNLCTAYYTLGLNRDGGMAEYLSVPAKTLVMIPSGTPLDIAALAQPLAVGFHAARRATMVAPRRATIIGAGAIGTFILLALRHLCPTADITVLDVDEEKLLRAGRFGATHTVSVIDAPHELDGEKQQMDVVIEASGVGAQLNRAIEFTRTGGTILAVGLPKSAPTVDIREMVLRELTMITSAAHICETDMASAVKLLAELGPRALELIEVVTTLERLPGWLEKLAQGKVDGKILVDPTASGTEREPDLSTSLEH